MRKRNEECNTKAEGRASKAFLSWLAGQNKNDLLMAHHDFPAEGQLVIPELQEIYAAGQA
jgi:hypothetical protein